MKNIICRKGDQQDEETAVRAFVLRDSRDSDDCIGPGIIDDGRMIKNDELARQPRLSLLAEPSIGA